MSQTRKLQSVGMNLLYALIGAVMLLPIYYLLVTTFKTPAEATESPLGLPRSLSLGNYIEAFNAMNYPRAFMNNLLITGIAVVVLVLISSMAAYVIARSNKRIFKWMFAIFMVGLIIPFQIAIIPLYKIIAGLHLMNTLPGVILIDVFCINLPLSIFLFRGFINTVPIELEEAAGIDGYGTFRTFWSIIFPLLKPIVSTVAILDALAIWNDFLTPLLFLQDPNKAVLLQEVYKNVGPFSTDWTSFFPMLVLSTLPLVIFFLIMQKSIIDGVVAGAVKG